MIRSISFAVILVGQAGTLTMTQRTIEQQCGNVSLNRIHDIQVHIKPVTLRVKISVVFTLFLRDLCKVFTHGTILTIIDEETGVVATCGGNIVCLIDVKTGRVVKRFKQDKDGGQVLSLFCLNQYI